MTPWYFVITERLPWSQQSPGSVFQQPEGIPRMTLLTRIDLWPTTTLPHRYYTPTVFPSPNEWLRQNLSCGSARLINMFSHPSLSFVVSWEWSDNATILLFFSLFWALHPQPPPYTLSISLKHTHTGASAHTAYRTVMSTDRLLRSALRPCDLLTPGDCCGDGSKLSTFNPPDTLI